jgi:hypothetical protein
MKHLRVWFYNPALDHEGIINKMVASIDRPFCHVEVQFADDRACSIYMGSSVTLRVRTFESPNYVCLNVPCSDVQHTLAAGHAEHIHEQGLLFSSLQMTSCLLWAHAAPSAKHTFCSKLVTEILQQAGLVSISVDAHRTSPSALHRLLLAQAPPAPLIAPVVLSVRTVALDFKIQR